MAIKSHKIFLDSSVFYAFIDRADNNHSKAALIIESLAKMKYQLFTSSLVVSETYAALIHETGLAVALDFLGVILESDIEILFPQKVDFTAAYKVIKSNRENQISLREAVNAVLMERRDISQIVTYNYWHNLFGTYTSSVIN